MATTERSPLLVRDQSCFELSCESEKLTRCDRLAGSLAPTEETAATFSSNSRTRQNTSNLGTMMHLLKMNIGPGILATPFAFSKSGLWVGLIGAFAIGCICIHCMHLLLNSCRILCARLKVERLDYGQVVELCFESGPESLQKFSAAMRRMTNVFLCLTQLGFCSIYFVFISDNIAQVVAYYYPAISLTKLHYMTILLPLLMLYCCIRSLETLAPLSLMANVTFAVGLTITFYDLLKDPPPVSVVSPFRPISELPIFFGSMVYAFEGIGCILPIENSMRSPWNFPGWTGILNTGMVVVMVLYAGTGFFGYLKYGDAVLGSVTLNLPTNRGENQAVKLLLAAAQFHSIAVQFYVAFVIIWPSFSRQLEERCLHASANVCRLSVYECLLRAGLILLTYVVAAALGESLGVLISLVGSMLSSVLALVLPALLDTALSWDQTSERFGKLRVFKNAVVMLLGVVGCVTGTSVALQDIIQLMQRSDQPAATFMLPSNCTQ